MCFLVDYRTLEANALVKARTSVGVPARYDPLFQHLHSVHRRHFIVLVIRKPVVQH